MAGDLAIYGFCAAGVSFALVVGFSLPALTENASTLSTAQARDARITEVVSLCQTTLPGVDCVCFGAKVAEILDEEKPRGGMGIAYVDRQVLAREQGANSC